MYGESSSIVCHTDIWKTCVICGNLNKQILMKSINKASHLHMLVAYLKFTGSIDVGRDFAAYDEQKTYECYICTNHIEAPAKAIRKIYAFPSEGGLVDGKLDPERLLTVLKEYMPLEYQKCTLSDLDSAIPSTKVPIEREVQRTDCSCCKALERTRNRLKTVIENSEESPSCYILNFAVFEELTELAHDLNNNFSKVIRFVPPAQGLAIQKQDELEIVPCETVKQDVHERYLVGFEQQQIISPTEHLRLRNIENRMQYKMKPQLEPIQYPPLRHISILPSFPGIPYSPSPIQHFFSPSPILKDTNEKFVVPIKTEPTHYSKPRKRTYPLPPALIELSTHQESSSRKPARLLPNSSKRFLESNNSNFSPISYSQSSRNQDQLASDYAKEIMNSKLIVFSKHDLSSMFPEKYSHIVQIALSTLESLSLIYSHSTTELTVYVKEIRREFLKQLWTYGIIPEHYRQRIIGLDSTERVRSQFEKYKNALIEMNFKSQYTELIGNILSSSNNSELEIEFGKFDSGSEDPLVYFVQKENSEAGIPEQ